MGFNLRFGLRRGCCCLVVDLCLVVGVWVVGYLVCVHFGLDVFLGLWFYYDLERGCGVSRLLEVVWWITWLRVCVNSVGIRCSVYSYLLLVSLCLTGVRVFGFCGVVLFWALVWILLLVLDGSMG